jgi:hypothetical protein
MLIIGDTATLIATLAMLYVLITRGMALDILVFAGLVIMAVANTAYGFVIDVSAQNEVTLVEIIFSTGLVLLTEGIRRHHGPQTSSEEGSKEAQQAAQAKDTQRLDSYWIGEGK